MPQPPATAGIQVHPAETHRFDDLATILNPNGNDRACWCMAYRIPSSEYNALRGEHRADRVRELCAERPVPGLLAYVDGTPAGWCGVSPRSSLARLRRSRTIPTIDDIPVWSVICFVVRSGFRRQGVTHALLEGAVTHARSSGAPVIEGYPVDPDGARINSSAAHVGTTGLFESAGFRRVRQTEAHSGGLPRWLMRLDL